MAARTNYEDDNVFLNLSLKNLQTSLALDLDSDLFLDKIVHDILFHSETLNKLFASLIRNTFLIQRAELLRLLLISKRDFVAFVDGIAAVNSNFAKELLAFMPQFRQCCRQHKDDVHEILAILETAPSAVETEADVISQDEYRFLFQPDQESDIVKV